MGCCGIEPNEIPGAGLTSLGTRDTPVLAAHPDTVRDAFAVSDPLGVSVAVPLAVRDAPAVCAAHSASACGSDRDPHHDSGTSSNDADDRAAADSGH
eukprot:tig00001021_g6296.t1